MTPVVGNRSRFFLETIPKRLGMWKQNKGQVTIFSNANYKPNVWTLSDLGSEVWNLCDGTRSVSQIISQIQKMSLGGDSTNLHDISSFTEQVCDFIESLAQNALLDLQRNQSVDVLLIQPPPPRYYTREILAIDDLACPPLGLLSVAASLEAHGFSVAVEDLHIKFARDGEAYEIMGSYTPRVIGISVSTPTFYPAIRLARVIKSQFPDVPIVAGGQHPTFMPEEVLRSGLFDVCVRQEGEITMREVTDVLLNRNGNSLSNVLGISYSDSQGEIKHNPSRPFVENLDELPPPDRGLLDMRPYHVPGTLITSRGCPANCIFCSCSAIAGRRIRHRSTDNIVTELRNLFENYDLAKFGFSDDTFTADPRRVKALCERFLGEGFGFEWGCLARVKPLPEELLEIMYSAGCRAIQFGVETAEPTILSSIGKKIELIEVIRAVELARRVGIPRIACSFILGLPGDTRDSIRKTIEFARNLVQKYDVEPMVGVLSPYPGTPVYEESERYGIHVVDQDWEKYTFDNVVCHPSNVSVSELTELFFEAMEVLYPNEEVRAASGNIAEAQVPEREAELVSSNRGT